MRELVTFKGGRDGLTVVLDSEADFREIIARLSEKLAEASRFLENSEVSVDIGPRDLDGEELESLVETIRSKGLCLRRILAGPRGERSVNSGMKGVEEVARKKVSWRLRKRKRKVQPVSSSSKHIVTEDEAQEAAAAVMQRMEVAQDKDDIPVIRYRKPAEPRADVVFDEQTILIQRTIRSGQRIFYPGNVVVLGDVNPGGEIIAGGNIIVMGTFRGIAHAGALGEEKAVVAALRLEPSQLRIAGYITRAPDGDFSAPQRQPEIARVQDGIVIIEQYQPGSDRYLNGLGKGGA
ncbi:MAG: septum site-determining protein MinC [Thermacetogeniaceae bacterium]